MHLLDLSASQREHYSALGVLAVDARGREVLLGLSPPESGFVVACMAKPEDTRTPQESQRLARLLVKHERARLSGLSFPDAVAKDETRQG